MGLCHTLFDYFSETAFVFMFFLPGDSLLLTVGALCSVVELMHLGYMITLLTVAATLGYIVNYLLAPFWKPYF
jgi:membrane-associated protein